MKTQMKIFVIAFLALGCISASAMQKNNKKVLNTQLCKAAGNGNLQAVQGLIQDGADPNVILNNWSPLMLAAYQAHREIVEFLIQKGADLNLCNAYGHTALSRAALMGNEKIVQCLIKAGADPDARANPHAAAGSANETPLMQAAKRGHKEIAECLLCAGAQLYLQDNYGNTALKYAALGCHQFVCELFVEKMLGYQKSAWAAYFCMENIKGNIFEGIKIPFCERLRIMHCLGEVEKIQNDEIRNALIAKYFSGEAEK